MYDNTNISIEKHRIKFNKYFNNLLKSYLSKNELSKVMFYGISNGGKRIRPFLINKFSKIVKLPKTNYYYLSASDECIHSYSLIHDDLPSMDNDDYRRGKLSVHRKFNEAEAILAGDSLHDISNFSNTKVFPLRIHSNFLIFEVSKSRMVLSRKS